MKKCLVIVDMQNDFINQYTEHIPHKTAKFIEEHYFDRIIATRYCNTHETACYKLGNWKECMTGTPEAEIVSVIKPSVQRTFDKTTYSGFTNEFREYIQRKGGDKLFFCGMNTDCCVLATVLSCYDAVQECVVISDLCASTLGEEKHNHALDLLRDNITSDKVVNSFEIDKNLNF